MGWINGEKYAKKSRETATLSIFGNYVKKHTLNLIIKKNVSNICHFLFQNTVLHTVHTVQIHKPKIRILFLYLLFYFLLDLEQ